MRGAVAFSLSAGAVVWSGLLLVGVFTADVYTGSSSDAGDFEATLVEVNGAGALWFLAAPLALSVASFLLLRSVCHGGRGHAAGWTLAVLLYAASVISGFSVGMFIMPAALALLVATAIVPRPR